MSVLVLFQKIQELTEEVARLRRLILVSSQPFTPSACSSNVAKKKRRVTLGPCDHDHIVKESESCGFFSTAPAPSVPPPSPSTSGVSSSPAQELKSESSTVASAGSEEIRDEKQEPSTPNSAIVDSLCAELRLQKERADSAELSLKQQPDEHNTQMAALLQHHVKDLDEKEQVLMALHESTIKDLATFLQA